MSTATRSSGSPGDRRSWVDALIAGIDRLPMPPWVLYLLAALAFGAASVLLRWSDGSVPYPAISPITTVFAMGAPYVFGVVHHLGRAARRALVEFRRALGELDARYAELEVRLTTMTPWQAWLAVPLGAIPPVIGQLGGGWGITARTSIATSVYTVVVQVLLNVSLALFLMRVGRQLRTIVRIHREASAIRLSDTLAHSAFSRLTFRAAVLVLVPYAIVEVAANLLDESTIVEMILFALSLIVSVAVFVLPLLGMHRRLVTLKRAEILELETAFDRTSARLLATVAEAAPVGAGGFGGAGGGGRSETMTALSEAIGALEVSRERVRRSSAWPWAPEAVRGFVTSVALPILLWLASTALDRLS